MRARQRRRWACAAAAICVLTACGGGSNNAASSAASDRASDASSDSLSTDATASSSDPRTPEQLKADQELAASLLLTVADLPRGWTASPRKPRSDSPALTDAGSQFALCLGVPPEEVGAVIDHEEKAKARSDKLKFGKNQEIENEITVKATADDAENALSLFQRPGTLDCFKDFFDTGVQAELSESGDFSEQGISIGAIEIQPATLDLHTDAVTYRASLPISAPGITIDARFDFVFAVKGRTELTFTFSNLGELFPEDLEVEAANIVIDRTPES